MKRKLFTVMMAVAMLMLGCVPALASGYEPIQPPSVQKETVSAGDTVIQPRLMANVGCSLQKSNATTLRVYANCYTNTSATVLYTIRLQRLVNGSWTTIDTHSAIKTGVSTYVTWYPTPGRGYSYRAEIVYSVIGLPSTTLYTKTVAL